MRAILNENASRRPISARGLFVVSLAGAISATALASLRASDPPAPKPPAPLNAGAPAPQAQPAGRVTAVCVDSDGKPVPGAEVHLFQYAGTADDGRYVHSGPFTSDDAGKVVCSDAILQDRDLHDRWFYARVPDRLVGAARSAKWRQRAAFNAEGRIVMRASRSIEGQVTVPQGFDPTTVTVRVRGMQLRSGPGVMDYDSFTREPRFRGLDTSLPGIFECRPDAEGRIRFKDVPVRGRVYLVTTGAGLGEAQWANNLGEAEFGQPIRLTIGEESLLTGRVLLPGGMPAAGMRVTAQLSPDAHRQISYLSSFEATTDDEGSFVVHGLPEAELVLSVEDPKKRWVFRPLENLLVHARRDPKLALEMEAGVRVSGRILNGDGQPVEGAGFSAVAHANGGSGLSDDVTPASGRYEFRLPAGNACLYFNSLPDGYAYPEPQIVKNLEIRPGQDDIQDLDFVLRRNSD